MPIVIYLCLLLILILATVAAWVNDNEIAVVLVTSALVVWLTLGFLAPMGIDDVYDHKATSTIVGNEIIIQGDFPTMTSGEMKFIDKPLKVRVTKENTVWGYSIEPLGYKIMLDDAKQAESPENKQ